MRQAVVEKALKQEPVEVSCTRDELDPQQDKVELQIQNECKAPAQLAFLPDFTAKKRKMSGRL